MDALRHIGLVGKKRSGKDTAAMALTAIGWERVAFADRLRSMALAIDPWIGVEYDEETVLHVSRLSRIVDDEGWEEAKNYTDVRQFLQRLGTDAVRDHLGDNLWVEAAMANLNGPSVFTDCRFPNEAKAIREAGGLIVNIQRPSLPDDGDAHASENAMGEYVYDHTVVNNGTIDELHANMWVIARAAGWSEPERPTLEERVERIESRLGLDGEPIVV